MPPKTSVSGSKVNNAARTKLLAWERLMERSLPHDDSGCFRGWGRLVSFTVHAVRTRQGVVGAENDIPIQNKKWACTSSFTSGTEVTRIVSSEMFKNIKWLLSVKLLLRFAVVVTLSYLLYGVKVHWLIRNQDLNSTTSLKRWISINCGTGRRRSTRWLESRILITFNRSKIMVGGSGIS